MDRPHAGASLARLAAPRLGAVRRVTARDVQLTTSRWASLSSARPVGQCDKTRHLATNKVGTQNSLLPLPAVVFPSTWARGRSLTLFALLQLGPRQRQRPRLRNVRPASVTGPGTSCRPSALGSPCLLVRAGWARVALRSLVARDGGLPHPHPRTSRCPACRRPASRPAGQPRALASGRLGALRHSSMCPAYVMRRT